MDPMSRKKPAKKKTAKKVFRRSPFKPTRLAEHRETFGLDRPMPGPVAYKRVLAMLDDFPDGLDVDLEESRGPKS